MILRNDVVAALLSIVTFVAGQSLIPEGSFGQGDKLAPDGHKIPGWALSGSGHVPQINSDRVMLTPPVPPNTRGALWTDNAIHAEQWTAELEIRASGHDGGSGNFVLWYVQNKGVIGQDSVYTVGQFDGLAILVDQYGGRGGSVRGFLNDGTQNYHLMGNFDHLAFGHCDYSYRNLGRPSKLRVSSHDGLSVYVDDRLCFSSDKISLPAGNFFGITASTGENPDIIEAFKFTLLSGGGSILGSTHPHHHNERSSEHHDDGSSLPGSPEALPDVAADEIKSTEAQFADLHNRLQGLQHQVADMNAHFIMLSRQVEQKAVEIIGGLPNIPQDSLNRLSQRVENTERIVQAIQRDVEGRDYKQHFNELNEAMANVRGGLTDALPESLGKIVTASAPSMGFYLFIIIAVQVMLAGAYVLYKRRRASAPKKYL